MALSKIDSDGIVDGGITADSLNIGQIGGRRNLIINGAMQVAQRGTSAEDAGGGYNTLDRWRTSQSSSGFGGASGLDQFQSTDAPDGFANSLKFVKNGATSINSSVAAYLEYKIEGQDIQHLKYGTSSAQSVTLSFWVKNSIVGTYGLTLIEAGNARYNTQAYTVNTANTWEYKTVTFVGDTVSSLANDNTEELNIAFVLGAGTGYQTATTNTWGSSQTFSTSSQVQWPETDDAEFYITGVQLEVGSVATPFEHRSYGEELALCQRYYQAFLSAGDGVNAYYGMGHFYTAGALVGHVELQTTMRTAPSVVSTNSSANNFRWFSAGTSGFYGGHTINNATPNHVGFNCMNDLTDGTQGNPAGLSKYDSASYLHFNAEL